MPRARNYDLLENGTVILKCVSANEIAKVLKLPSDRVSFYANNGTVRFKKYTVEYNDSEADIVKEDWIPAWMEEWERWRLKIRRAVF